jgi:hypothetical protein
MRIFHSDASDPMLLDRQVGLHALANKLRAFLDGAVGSAQFRAEQTGDPAPYSEVLAGLRVLRAPSGAPGLQIANDRWLELTAPPEDLEMLYANLADVTDGGHIHFYACPVSLILEADNAWPGFGEG